MRLSKIIPAILAFTMSASILTGCDEVQIFQKETDPYALVPLKDTELSNDVYYVKNNTRFYAVHKPESGSASSEVSVLNETRVFVTMEDESLIPTYYKDELIAVQSETIDLNNVILERFNELGFSFGCYNGTVTDDGYLYFDPKDSLVDGSSLSSAIGDTSSTDIRIASIDGNTLVSDQINKTAGIIKGLEEQKSYKVGYYVGTKYCEKKITADCKMYGAYEMFSYGEEYISDTPNGYMCFTMPEDLKSGYYNINGQGLFKYYNFNRGEMDENEVSLNESYYLDDRSKIEAYSRQYSVSVPKRVKDLKITVDLESTETEFAEDVIQGIVFAPDGTQMSMDFNEEDKELSISLAEGMAGDWTVNVIPKTLNIKEVTVDNDKAAEEATCEETVFTLPEDRENIEFYAEYTSFKTNVKDCTVFGTVLAEDGKTYEMTLGVDETDRNNPIYYIYYELPYAAAGDYIVRIYHHPEETTIQTPIVRDKTETDTEIIIVEG